MPMLYEKSTKNLAKLSDEVAKISTTIMKVNPQISLPVNQGWLMIPETICWQHLQSPRCTMVINVVSMEMTATAIHLLLPMLHIISDVLKFNLNVEKVDPIVPHLTVGVVHYMCLIVAWYALGYIGVVKKGLGDISAMFMILTKEKFSFAVH